MTPRKVSPVELEALLEAATDRGQRAVIEMGDPLIDVLVVDGRDVAYAPKAGAA